MPGLAELLGALSDPLRVRVLAAVLAEPGISLGDLSQEHGIAAGTVRRAVSALAESGLLTTAGSGGLVADLYPIRQHAARMVDRLPLSSAVPGHPRLRGCIKKGTIIEVPVQWDLCVELCDLVLSVLQTDFPCQESDLTRSLSELAEDPVRIRRLLVDTGRLTRDPQSGVYDKAASRGRPGE